MAKVNKDVKIKQEIKLALASLDAVSQFTMMPDMRTNLNQAKLTLSKLLETL